MTSGSTVAVLGAGPAGLYAAKKLASAGHRVALLNRDIRPGGLAEYGIFYTKHKMKSGLRKQFAKILDMPDVHYYGNVTVGAEESVTLEDLKGLGFDAFVVATGAQGVRWIRVEGSRALNVHDAKTIVYHSNALPPWADMDIHRGQHLAIIGAGNVSVDMIHWAVRENIPEITVLVRRGPMQKKYTDKELGYIGGHIDRESLRAEFERLRDTLTNIGEDADEAYSAIEKPMKDQRIEGSDSVVRFRYACQAKIVHANERDEIIGLTLDENALSLDRGRIKCLPSGETTRIEVDQLIFAVGDTVDPAFGLPLNEWGEYARNEQTEDPENPNYEVFDPIQAAKVAGWFVVGWSRKASDGLVGKARQDAERGCEAVLEWLESNGGGNGDPVAALDKLLAAREIEAVDWSRFQKIRAAEVATAEERGLPDFRFGTNDEMLAV